MLDLYSKRNLFIKHVIVIKYQLYKVDCLNLKKNYNNK